MPGYTSQIYTVSAPLQRDLIQLDKICLSSCENIAEHFDYGVKLQQLGGFNESAEHNHIGDTQVSQFRCDFLRRNVDCSDILTLDFAVDY